MKNNSYEELSYKKTSVKNYLELDISEVYNLPTFLTYIILA